VRNTQTRTDSDLSERARLSRFHVKSQLVRSGPEFEHITTNSLLTDGLSPRQPSGILIAHLNFSHAVLLAAWSDLGLCPVACTDFLKGSGRKKKKRAHIARPHHRRRHFSTRFGSQEGTLACVFQQLGHKEGGRRHCLCSARCSASLPFRSIGAFSQHALRSEQRPVILWCKAVSL